MNYLIYFSPTGTSAKIAGAIGEGLEGGAATINVTHTPVNTTLSADDLVVVAVPVYGGHPARTALSRLEGLRGDNTPCVAVAVYGNRAFENAVSDLSAFLKERGFRTIAAGAFIGEHSYSRKSTPIAGGRPDCDDLGIARKFGAEIACGRHDAESIDLSVLKDEPVSPEGAKKFGEFIAEYRNNPGPRVPDIDSTLCTRCRTCVSTCPTGAIDADSLECDASACIRCCACVKSCREGARRFDSPFAPVLSSIFGKRKSPVTVIG